jgi:glycosyltransferase involved in cell wall biosynthesis
LNILQVTAYLITSFFGGEPAQEIYGLAKALVERGHQVTIYTTDALNKEGKLKYPTRTINMDGVKVCESKSWEGKLGRRYPFHFSPAMVPLMAKQTATFDIIHLHQYPTFLNMVAHHYAQKYHIPYVLQAHGSLRGGLTASPLLRQVHNLLWGRRILKDAGRLIAVSPMEAEQYRDMGVNENKIRVIPNGVDLSEFDALPGRGEFRRKYNLGGDRKIILYLGRIHRTKGLDLLARAFADLSRSLSDTKLVIVGPDSGYLSSLEKLITGLELSDKVLFTGPLYGQEKLSAYVDADVYVLPSVYEIFGITIFEACICGTPVIVTDRCGLADTIKGQAGLVVPCEKERLQQALLNMLGNDKLRREFGEKGRLLVREKFNWEKVAEQTEKMYQEIL